MKIVIYDDETLEPITFVNLRGVDRREIEKRGMVLRVAVPRPLNLIARRGELDPMVMEKMEVIDLYFEPFRRQTPRHGLQETIICFTNAIDLAVRLAPSWMLGQQSAVEYLQTQNDRLTDMLISVLKAPE